MSALIIMTLSKRADSAAQVRSDTKESRYSSSAARSSEASNGSQPLASGPSAIRRSSPAVRPAFLAIAACSVHTYSAGESFYETGTTPTIATNASQTSPVTLRVTYVVPKGANTRRDVPASQIPTC